MFKSIIVNTCIDKNLSIMAMSKHYEIEAPLGGICQTLNKSASFHQDLPIEQISALKKIKNHVKKNSIINVKEPTKCAEQYLQNKPHELKAVRINDASKASNYAMLKFAKCSLDYPSAQGQNKWKTIGLMLLSAIAASILCVWLAIPKLMTLLTSDLSTTHKNGVFIDQLWPRLPENIRQSIDNVALKDFNKEYPLLTSLPNDADSDDPNFDNYRKEILQ